MNSNEVVYISNIPKQASLADLHGFLKSSGNVVGAAFMRENRNDCRTKIAFVLFENTAQAVEACNLDQTLFQAHRLSILLSNDDRKFLAGYTIMIENTSSDTSEEDLYEACCRYGSVEAVQIPTNYYAFVGFAERSAAHAAQRKLDNAMLKKEKVQVKVLNEDVRVRLEDLDSFKTPRVYNELLRAKQQYYDGQQESRNAIPNNRQSEDHYQQIEQCFDDNVNNDEGFQQFLNDSNVFAPVPHEGSFFEEEYNPRQVYRRDVKFGKQRFVPTNKTSVKVENVPRDVYDEDVVIYFQQFGPIVSMERGLCLSSIFTKVYTITYQDQDSQRRAINCLRREVTLSGLKCTIFTMIPGEALQPVSSQCVLISYLSNHVLHSEIIEAFANIGDVLYIEKRVRNNGPTIVHFCHPININEACRINMIAGNKVNVVACSLKEFQKFAANITAFKKAVKGKWKGTPKSQYLIEIEAKEEHEKVENIIFKTAHDPHYRNPDPRKYSFEVVLYNCPIGTTLQQVKNYFKRAAEVLAIRHEPSPFDTNSWKVHVSFGNYLDAFRAIRLKGKFEGEYVYKHIATESPKLDCVEAVMVKVDSGKNITLSRVTRGLTNVGGLYFAEKVGNNEFVIIFRDMKVAKRACAMKKFDNCRLEICCMRDFIKLNEGLARIKGQHAEKNLQGMENEDEGKPMRPLVLLSDVLSAKMRTAAPVATEQKKVPKPEAKIKVIDEARDPVPLKLEKVDPPPEVPKATTSASNIAPPPAKIPQPSEKKSPDLRKFLAERRIVKTECHEKLNDLEEIERAIKQKAIDIKRRLQQLERDEANVTALLPSSNRSQQADETPTESGSSKRRSGSTHRGPSPMGGDRGSSNHRIVMHTTGAVRGTSSRQMIMDQTRSVSPSERLAHERYIQIREEKIAISQELDSLRQRFDYRKSSRVGALKDLMAGLDREQRDIQIQLEAKRRFRVHDDFGYSGTSFDRSPSPATRRQQHHRSLSRSRSPFRSGSRSRSRNLTVSRSPSRSRSSDRSRPSRRTRISRSPLAYRPSRPKKPRTRSPSKSKSPSPQRGPSLEREMYNIGRYNTKHGKFTVYVANVSSRVTEREIEEIFGRYGRLNDIDFTRRKRCGEIYFDYTNREHAFKALEMNNVKISGRRLRVAFNTEKPSNREAYSLFFRVRKSISEVTIYRSYEPYGEIDFIWYPEGANFGTISFRRTEVAKEALAVKELIDGTQITTRPFIDKLKRDE